MRVQAPLLGLLAGAGLGAISTGIVLPFLLADIATARGFGTADATTALTALAVGTILGSYAGGRLGNRSQTGTAAGSKAAVGATMVLVAFVHGLPLILLGCLLLGVAISVGRPSISAMLLQLAPEDRRRDVFGWYFILMNAGMAAGAGYGGLVADLSSPSAMHRLYLTAATVSLGSALVIGLSRPGRTRADAASDQVLTERLGLGRQLRIPGLARVFLIQLILALALYAQFNSGLPALVLTGLHASTHVFGTAVAVNACLVAALTAPVVAYTRGHGAGRLLAGSSFLWLTGWLILALPLWTRTSTGTAVVIALVVMAIGETTVAPVMTPLAASLVADDQAAAVTATMATIFTTATTIGPMVGGALFTIAGSSGFVWTQLGLCAAALLLATRLPHPAPAESAASLPIVLDELPEPTG